MNPVLVGKLQDKIIAVVDALNASPNGWVKATDFDLSGDPRATILENPRGTQWNRYVHKNAIRNGFDIYKIGNRNYYVLRKNLRQFKNQFPTAIPNPRTDRASE